MAKRAEGFLNRDVTRRKAAQLAVSVVEFQKTTLRNSINLIGKAQEQTGRILHDLLKKAEWVPSEGREVIDEWNHAMKRGREEFKKTSDKSFDLIIQYLERVQRNEQKSPAAPTMSAKSAFPEKSAPSAAAVKSAAKKPATKKPAAAKKPTAKKSAAKKPAAKPSGTSGTSA